MAQGYAAEVEGVLDGTLIPAAKSSGIVVGAKLRRYRAVLDLADTAVKRASGDTNVLCRLPKNAAFAFGVMTISATLATSTVSIGVAGTPAKYKAAGTHTTTDTPTLFGKAGAIDDAPLAEEEDVIMTVGTADLPSSGIVVIDIFASAR